MRCKATNDRIVIDITEAETSAWGEGLFPYKGAGTSDANFVGKHVNLKFSRKFGLEEFTIDGKFLPEVDPELLSMLIEDALNYLRVKGRIREHSFIWDFYVLDDSNDTELTSIRGLRKEKK